MTPNQQHEWDRYQQRKVTAVGKICSLCRLPVGGSDLANDRHNVYHAEQIAEACGL
jgi:hypothetical protein